MEEGESVSAEWFWFIYSREQYKKCVQVSIGGSLQLSGSLFFPYFTVSIISASEKLGLSVLALNLGLCWDCQKTL